MRVGVAGPRGSRVLAKAFDSYLLVGDETALPAIARRLEEFPAGTSALAVILISAPSERQALPDRPNYKVIWVELSLIDRGEETELAKAVAAHPLPDGSCYAWIAGEAEEVRGVYRHLLHVRGLPKGHISASGHWRRGASNYDHHAPIDT